MKILGREIAIEYCSQTRLSVIADDAEAIGYYDGTIIYIKQTLSKAEKSRIFLHEVMHAIIGISGLSSLISEDQQEALCNVSECYHELFQDEEFKKHL